MYNDDDDDSDDDDDDDDDDDVDDDDDEWTCDAVLCQLSPSMMQRTLQCLKDVHQAQSGSLVSLLIECFLSTHLLALARMADSIAGRRLEMLLADSAEMVSSLLFSAAASTRVIFLLFKYSLL